MNEPKVLGDFHYLIWIAIHLFAADLIAPKAVALVVEPVRDPFDPVADVVCRIFQQRLCLVVVRKESEVAWQK